MRQNSNVFAAQCQGKLTNEQENRWQGRLDSNQRMPRSKPGALPLGDAPKFDHCNIYLTYQLNGRGGWIRTNGCRDQNPVPYHLATPLIQ